jgi:hypothetical protein
MRKILMMSVYSIFIFSCEKESSVPDQNSRSMAIRNASLSYLPFLLVSILLSFGCTKHDPESSVLKIGTYTGVKRIYYQSTRFESADTITLTFDTDGYSYSGSGNLDFGRGTYLLKDNTIQFNDEEARVALYSWDWIITGFYQYKLIDDSLILNHDGSNVQISCRLRKSTN